MNRVDELFEQVANGAIDLGLRIAILDEVVHCLESKKDELGTWEKSLFAHSLAYLAINSMSPNQPTSLWLRICLSSLEKAMVPKDERNDDYTVDTEATDSLTYEFLLREAGKVRQLVANNG